MGYLTRLGAGAADQPIQAVQRPPVQDAAVPAASVEAEAAVEKSATPEPAPVPEAKEAPEPKEEPAQEAPQGGVTPMAPIQLDGPDTDDTAARKAHEEAEAKRRAKWEKEQAEKRAAEQAELDKLAALSDDDVSRISAHRVRADTEKITRRNMKEQVSEHIQDLCQRDSTFARRTMLPGKGMVECFQYITRKAYEYVQAEMKANGIKPGPGTEGYGSDVPDDLCFQWARDYFDAPVEKEEEKFVPKPYVPSAKSKPKAKKDGAKKDKAETKKPPEPKNEADSGQITLGGFAAMGEKAG